MKTLGDFNKFVLPNGLTVVIHKMDSVMSTSAILFVKTGAVFEEEEQRGISHLVEHSILLGTQKYPSTQEIYNITEGNGISYNGSTGSDSTFYTIKSPYSNFSIALELLSQFIFNPLLDENRVIKEKQVILSEYGDFWSNSERKFFQTMWMKRFKKEDHPYGRRPMGHPTSIENLDLETLKNWREKYYNPENMILSIVGNFEEKQIQEQVMDLFGKIKTGQLSEEPKFGTNDYSDMIVHSQYEDKDQVLFYLSFPTFGFKQVDRQKLLELRLLNAVLGKLRSSRLYSRLRGKEGLVYKVTSGYRTLSWMGSIAIDGSAPSKDIFKILEITIEELKKLVDEGITEAELSLAKNFLAAQVQLRFDSPPNIAGYLGEQIFYEGEIWLPEKEILEMGKITKSDIDSLIKVIFDFSKINIGLLGKVSPEELEAIKRSFKTTN